MRNPQDLRALATPGGGAPFDFAEFERRRAQVRHRARTAGWSAAAAIGMLAVVPVVAVLTQPEPAATVTGPPADAMTPVADVFPRAFASESALNCRKFRLGAKSNSKKGKCGIKESGFHDL